MNVAGLAGGVVAQKSRRAAGAARVDADHHVAVGHPLLRIDDFPVLVLVRGAREDIRVLLRHDFPGGLVAVLEREALAVGAIGEERRIAAGIVGAKHVRPQLEAVVHPDGHVPFYFHETAERTRAAAARPAVSRNETSTLAAVRSSATCVGPRR